MIPHEALLASAYCCVLAGVFLFVLQVAVVPPAPRPTLGARGLARSRAMIRAGLFPLAEPCIRAVAAWLPIGSSNRLWQRLDQVLDRSGNYLGLSGQELIASCTLAGAAVGSISFAILHAFEIPVGLSVIGASLGTLAPWLRVVAVARKRARSVDQQLPSAVELAAMCMGAGLDFPGSLRQIIDSAAEPDEPIFEEFAQILRELELGYTRRRALQGFASRVPTAAVRELVNSVAQAEEAA